MKKDQIDLVSYTDVHAQDSATTCTVIESLMHIMNHTSNLLYAAQEIINITDFSSPLENFVGCEPFDSSDN
jgi:hypothetical protein